MSSPGALALDDGVEGFDPILGLLGVRAEVIFHALGAARYDFFITSQASCVILVHRSAVFPVAPRRLPGFRFSILRTMVRDDAYAVPA